MIKIDVAQPLKFGEGVRLLQFAKEIPAGQLVALVGPSGGGKTTILRLLAGLMQPQKGKIEVGGAIWLDTQTKTYLPTRYRQLGMVFQDYALFPNMSVQENLNFAKNKATDPEEVRALVDIMDLQGLIDQKPKWLSGGQQQRVALARALIRRPRLLLLDEPLSALDHQLRSRLQDYILKVHEHFKLTTLLVSHDRQEVVKMADRILHIAEGQIQREEVPADAVKEQFLTIAARVARIEAKAGEFVLHLKLGDQLFQWPCPTLPKGLKEQDTITVNFTYEAGQLIPSNFGSTKGT